MHGITHLLEKIRAHHAYQLSMYRAKSQPNMPDFFLPFGGKLDSQNRWIKLASFVPWNMIEGEYEKNFASSGMGAPALTCRIALGSLIIKERLGLTDEQTAQNILENPYLQYFLGLHEYLRDSLFDPSMMVHFRKRITPEMLERVNQAIIDKARGIENDPPHPPQTHVSPEGKASDETPAPAPTQDAPKGKLVIDATATPADITYPTDLKILNEAREKTERIIDKLHATMLDGGPKPRTYRQKARRDFLNVALSKKPRANKIRTAIGKQLRYIKRNLGHIHNMLDNGADLRALRGYWHKCLMVIHTVYEQQLEMYRNRHHRCKHRIVSISQPHVRPIVRGKVAQSVEFGAKISMSHVDGYVSLDRLSWEAYNESNDLVPQTQAFYRRYGHYPASIHADKIYQTRANRAWCKERNIRLTGKPLGRPRAQTREEKRQQRQDEMERIVIEGKFGNVKRKGTLQRVMAKLANTSRTVIGVGIVVLNLDHWLRFLRALVEMLQRWLAAQTSQVIDERGRGNFSTALLPTR
jgi:transposase, IS5 family